jgi:hypothetical protein
MDGGSVRFPSIYMLANWQEQGNSKCNQCQQNFGSAAKWLEGTNEEENTQTHQDLSSHHWLNLPSGRIKYGRINGSMENPLKKYPTSNDLQVRILWNKRNLRDILIDQQIVGSSQRHRQQHDQTAFRFDREFAIDKRQKEIGRQLTTPRGTMEENVQPEEIRNFCL